MNDGREVWLGEARPPIPAEMEAAGKRDSSLAGITRPVTGPARHHLESL